MGLKQGAATKAYPPQQADLKARGAEVRHQARGSSSDLAQLQCESGGIEGSGSEVSKNDTCAVANASRDGKNNGQLATPQGPKTLSNKDLSKLDAARIGSKYGIMKKGK
jgi:hypothetical protein